MIEKRFDIPFVAELALREKQIQQNYRPIIAVHKWFARRPGTLFRALLLSEFVRGDLREIYYRAHNLAGKRIADPFMGGGTPLIEANRLGCDVVGYDINPMAYWIVRQEIAHLDVDAYREAASRLRMGLEQQIGAFHRTGCVECGAEDAHVKYFLWVKTQECDHCGSSFDLFPGYLLAENRRHPRNVLVCQACGELNEVEDRKHPGLCLACAVELSVRGPASRNCCVCPHCGRINKYPAPEQGAPRHRMFAIEHYCPRCKPQHAGRFFKKPDSQDLARYEAATRAWAQLGPRFVPDDAIPPGDETDRLHRWGYRLYREMFNERQLLGLELSGRAIAQQTDKAVRNALATNLSDLLRYQNMLCRYDTMALKSLDVFSVHGFPVGLVQCESNLLGISNGGEGTNVGSGGWSNIIEKYASAKGYCMAPFEVRQQGGRRVRLPVRGEWIGERIAGPWQVQERRVELHCASSTQADLPDGSVDAVLTDPPYFSNVQYAELMDFCYVWLRRLVADADEVFAKRSTRDENELTGNATMERDLAHFTEGLSAAFASMARALKPGAPLAFTYHHNTIEAYYPVVAAVLDAGLTCSASIPCPAEMGASIHINGTASSIVDTVFVCRSTGTVPRDTIVSSPEDVARLVGKDAERLKAAGLEPTQGDLRCIAHGHLARLAVWGLRVGWRPDRPTTEKLLLVASAVSKLGNWAAIAPYLPRRLAEAPLFQNWAACEAGVGYQTGETDEVSF